MNGKLNEVLNKNLAEAILVSAAVLNLLFGSLKLLNLLQIKYLLFYSPKVVDITIFSQEVDFWIWAISFFAIVMLILVLILLQRITPDRRLLILSFASIASFSVFAINASVATVLAVPLGFLLLFFFISRGFLGGVDRLNVATLILLGVVCLLVFVELASLLTWVWNVFDYSLPFGDSVYWRFANLDVQLFNAGYPLTPWLFIALLYAWIIVPLGKALFSRLFHREIVGKCAPLERVCLRSKLLVLSLALIIAAAAFVAYYASFHLPSSALVGTDSTYYYKWAQDMSVNGSFAALQTDRPVSHFLLSFVQQAGALSAQNVVLVMPVVCAIGMALAVFWFVRVGTKNDLVALASAFFSIVSFQMTVSVFAYSLANWLALVEAFVLLALLLKSFETRSWMFSVFSAFLGVVLLLTHPYMWDVVMAVLVLYSAWILFKLFYRNEDEKADLKRVIAVLVTNVGFYVVYAFVPFGERVVSGGSSFLGFMSPGLGLSAFVNVYNGIEFAVESWVGGLLAAPLLVALSIVGLFSLMDFSSKFNRLIVLSVAVPSLLMFFVSSESYFFYRLLYLLPCQVLAAMGLFWVFRKIDRLRMLKGGRTVLLFKIAVAFLVALFLLNYALRSVDGAPIHLLTP